MGEPSVSITHVRQKFSRTVWECWQSLLGNASYVCAWKLGETFAYSLCDTRVIAGKKQFHQLQSNQVAKMALVIPVKPQTGKRQGDDFVHNMLGNHCFGLRRVEKLGAVLDGVFFGVLFFHSRPSPKGHSEFEATADGVSQDVNPVFVTEFQGDRIPLHTVTILFGGPFENDGFQLVQHFLFLLRPHGLCTGKVHLVVNVLDELVKGGHWRLRNAILLSFPANFRHWNWIRHRRGLFIRCGRHV